MKKKVALSATAIAVLASAVPTHVALVQAEETGNLIYVNSTGAGNQNDGGTGTQQNPFKQLSTAVARAQDGDTIVVVGEGYVNDLWNGGPWVIDKDITIKGQGDVPPSLGIRPAGIVLGGNVKFEFVDINLYNASSAYMYANGHKLELINSTFSVNTQPIKLYAGLKADSNKQGSNGSIIVKTDSTFKGNGKKVAIDTIYAGGDSGTTTVPAEIQISQGYTGSITLTGIDGTGFTGNMDVTLFDVSPQLRGGSGVNSLTVGSDNLREVYASNIKNLHVTKGTITSGADALNNFSSITVDKGATLNFEERFLDINTESYFGTGNIVLPSSDVSLNITNPIQDGNTLNLWLEGYNSYLGDNGRLTVGQVYVNAPTNTGVEFEPHYADTKYDVLPIATDSGYAWTAVDPKNLPSEPEETEPVLTDITADQPTQSISMESLEEGTVPVATFIFNMVTNPPLDDMVWFDQFNPTIKVDGQEATSVDDEGYISYRVGDLNIYFQPDEGSDFQLQQMVVEFVDEDGQPTVPVKDTYELEISSGEVGPLTLTLNVEGLESELPDGGEPEVLLPNITDITFDNDTSAVSTTTTTFNADYNFTVIAEGDEAVDLAQYPLTFTFGGVPASPVEGTTNKYRVEDKNLVITVFSDRIELSSDNISLDSGEHIITMVDEKHSINETFKLLVEEPPVGIRGFMQPNGGTLKEVNTEELAIPFTVGFDSTQSKPVPFYRLKYSKVLLGDKECLYDVQSGMYLLPNSDLALEVKALDTVGEYTAILRNKDDKTQPVPKGEYSFTLESSDTSAEFNYVVTEEPVLTGITLITADIQIKNYSEFSSSNVPYIYYQFKTQTDGDIPEGVTLEFFEPTIKVGDHEATLVKKDTGNYYRVDDLNLNIEFEAITGTNAQNMNIKFIDKDGQPTVPTQEFYEFTISKGDISPVTTQLRIEDFPKPEEPTPQPTEPTIVGFSQSSYSTTKLATDELAIPFTVNIDNAPDQPIAFNELVGSKVIFDGEEWEYVEGYYYKPRLDAKLEIEVGEQVGQYTAILKHSRLQEYLSEGDYSFTLGTPDNQATLKYTVKPSMYGFVSLIDLNRTFKPSDFLATEDQQPFFIFNVARTGESSDLDTYEEFKVTINGEETQKVTVEGDGKLYYQASNQMVQAYIDYDEESTNHTLVLQSYNGDVPLKEKYEVTLSHPSAGTLTLTANVKEEEVPPTPVDPDPVPDPTPDGGGNGGGEPDPDPEPPTPDGEEGGENQDPQPTTPKVTGIGHTSEYSDGVTVTSEESVGGIRLPFIVLFDGDTPDVEFNELGGTLEFGEGTRELGKYNADKNEYYFEQCNVVAKVVKDSPGNYTATFNKLDEGGRVTAFNSGEFYAALGIDGDNYSAIRLTVTPPAEPEPELPTEPSTPDTTEVTYTLPEGQANQEKTVTKKAGMLSSHNFFITPQFAPTTPEVNSFLNGLTVTIGGHKAERVGESYLWKAEEVDISLGIGPTGDDGYKVSFDPVKPSDGSILDDGQYTATIQYGDSNPVATFKLNVESEQVTPTPPPVVDPDPVDPTPPPVDPDPDKPSTEEPGNTGGNGGGSGQPTTPTPPTEPDNKEEEKEEPGTNNGGSSSGGVTPEPKPENPPSSGGTTTQPTNPPSGSGSTGGSSSGSSSTGGSGGSSSGGTTLPAPDPKPEKPAEKPPVVDKPTPVPPQQEETKPTTRPTVKPGAIASAVEALEKLSTTIKEKVDSLLTEVIEQAKGLVLDLTGDSDDLSSVSTLEVTKDGVFANVDGQPVKFATDLKLNDMSKLRITRTDGSPIPYKTDGTGFTITTHNFSDILITERVVEPFVDVAKDDWFQPYVDEMYNRGITTGTTATTFSPNASITRAQLAALLARTYELKPTGKKPVLTDTADQWYAADVQALVDLGIIKGYEDGTFRGDEPITREHLAMMLQRLAEKLGKDANPVKEPNFTDTAKMSAEGKSAVQWAAEQGIINSGQGTAFKPKSDATRAQVAKMLTLFINK